MYNAETRKVINSRNIRWADWHGSASPTDGMTAYDNDTTGIDDIMDTHNADDEKQVDSVKNVLDTESQISKNSGFEAGGENSTKEDNVTSKPKISKLDREIKKLEWTPESMPTSGRRSTNIGSENIQDDEDENKPVEVRYIYSTTLASDPGEPRQYKNAMLSTEKDLWIKAIKEEIGNFYKRDVWKKVPRSVLQGKKPLGNRWVFKKKVETNGSVRYKARVVVKG